MVIYGKGLLIEKNTSRVIHDFANGPFETLNTEIIKWALECGFTDKKAEETIKPIHNENHIEKSVIKKLFGKKKNE